MFYLPSAASGPSAGSICAQLLPAALPSHASRLYQTLLTYCLNPLIGTIGHVVGFELSLKGHAKIHHTPYWLKANSEPHCLLWSMS
jgi:hypothetical protein